MLCDVKWCYCVQYCCVTVCYYFSCPHWQRPEHFYFHGTKFSERYCLSFIHLFYSYFLYMYNTVYIYSFQYFISKEFGVVLLLTLRDFLGKHFFIKLLSHCQLNSSALSVQWIQLLWGQLTRLSKLTVAGAPVTSALR